jgi:hypothetical protein
MIAVGLLLVAATYLFGSWLAGLSTAVLLLIWRLMRGVPGPAVIPMAFTFQWTQITAGLYYHGLTGAMLPAIEGADWQRMVLLGLGCLTAMALGVRGGMELLRRLWCEDDAPPAADDAFEWRTLLIVYAAAIATAGAIHELAWQYTGLTQAILALSFSRLAVLFLMMRRLVAPTFQWRWIAVLLALETLLGFTGYFAGFREPLIMAVIATLEVFDRRNAQHWAVAVALAVVLGLSSLVWMGVRTEYRQDFESEALATSRTARLERMQELASAWFDQDTYERLQDINSLVDRIWAIHYPALALDRVPSFLPHTGGTIIGGALWHLVTPRILFPNKPELPSDSEMVRKYSGVWVAGAEQNTSIAFGYAAESYVDFGVPLMFLPALVFGLAMGAFHRGLLRTLRHRDVAIPLLTVIFWLGLYLFERSWIKTLGMTVTMTVYLGGFGFLLDRYLTLREERAFERAIPAALPGGEGAR